MDFFKWNEQFQTGLTNVDEQHHRLVDILNAFIQSVSSQDAIARTELEQITDELLEYAKYHFREEEKLMQEAGVDPRHFEPHHQQHQAYTEEIQRERRQFADDPIAARNLLRFLGHWLVYHILGCDQSMAHQIAAIHSGATPQQAFAQERQQRETTSDPLLHAMDAMIEQVMQRNSQLLRLNETLELRVAERTRALQEANAQLSGLVDRLEAQMAESRRLGAELVSSNENLRQQAMTDALTGLPNRRHALERLAQLWSESVRHGTPLACIMIDADGFKTVNDTYGHDAGDSVLCELAHLLRSHTRLEDMVCRLGGDEFLILCPQTELNGAVRLAEHLREKASTLQVHLGTGEWHGSLSLGVAERTPYCARADDLINQADKALYLAKRSGRNRVATLQQDAK